MDISAFSELEALTESFMKRLSNFALDLGLTRFPQHLNTFLTSLFFFLAIHQTFAPLISGWLSSSFRKMNSRGKNNCVTYTTVWMYGLNVNSRVSYAFDRSIRVVSQLHALAIVPLALRALDSPVLDKDRAFGWDEDKSGSLQAIASAYFVWDTLDAIINYTDFGFIVHGLACSMIYLLSFTPFLSYYAARCLLWESSTIFLNIHWFLDKTNRTGSTFQLINGILLLATFFGMRLVYGAYVSYNFFFTLYDVRDKVPWSYLFVYGVGNVVLQGLNVVWFVKMIRALQKRFTSNPSVNRTSVKASRKLDAKKE